MRPRRSVGRLAVGLIATSLWVSACSGSPSLEDYIGEMESATDAWVAESQDLSYDYQSTVEDGVREIVASGAQDPEATAIELVRAETVGYLALLGDLMVRYGEAIAEPRAPDVIADAHRSYVDAVGFVAASVPDVRVAVEEADSIGAVQLALSSSGFADGQLRWTATCRALEQAVRDEGRGIDLKCIPPETP